MKAKVTNTEIHDRMMDMEFPRLVMNNDPKVREWTHKCLVGLFKGHLLIVDNRGPEQFAGTCNVDINSLKPL